MKAYPKHQVHQLQCRKKVMNSFTIKEQVYELDHVLDLELDHVQGHELDQVLVLTAVIADSV